MYEKPKNCQIKSPILIIGGGDLHPLYPVRNFVLDYFEKSQLESEKGKIIVATINGGIENKRKESKHHHCIHV